MRQLMQDLAKGDTLLVEAPTPIVTSNTLLVDTTTTLISAGTERMLVSFGQSSLLQKARHQPDKVKMVLNKVQTDGFLPTLDSVRSKLEQPLPLGYCNVGVVAGAGDSVMGFRPGDRVVSNGPHADVVKVPKNLSAKIPDGVSDEAASFTVVASIGLQGIRLASPTLGEVFVVTGVGLIGLLTVQLLHAHGCRVLAIDNDQRKLQLARDFGAAVCNPSKGDDPVEAGLVFSRGRGVDGVIITASTKSSDPVAQAARMSRKRGRIVLVGVTGLELNRADFYEKELSFQVSCSYGPGRYDPDYEEGGLDYPIGFVRWTEQRNFEAVLDMMASGQLDLAPMITHRFNFNDAAQAYKVLTEDSAALGILLQYRPEPANRHVHSISLSTSSNLNPMRPVIGVVGAGNYAGRVLIPAFKAAGAQLHTIVTTGSINGVVHGRKAGFIEASTDVNAVLANSEINSVVIATRHDSHATLVSRTLLAGKNVFVEKPLAVNLEQLGEISAAQDETREKGQEIHLMVGFNRRFAPHIQKMKELLTTVAAPKTFIMTINAGSIPADHWTQDAQIGGGRIIGEACHFIDLMRFLAGTPITSVQACGMGDTPGARTPEDKATITLGFADGSFGSVHYLANGSSRFPKERIEVFTSGRILQLDNFIKLRGYAWPGFRHMNLWRQDKGQKACAVAFLNAVEKGGEPPISAAELFEVARVTIEAAKLLRQR